MTDREIMRSHKMAEYMYLHATDEEFGQDAKQMYVLGLLHDIGHIAPDGKAEFLSEIGFQNFDILDRQDMPISISDMKEHKELLLLQIADIRVSSQGKIGTYQDRLKDVADRYGSESPEYQMMKLKISRIKSIMKLDWR